jgi:hypothetical protein
MPRRLLTGDTIQVLPDNACVTFMRSSRNLIPRRPPR